MAQSFIESSNSQKKLGFSVIYMLPSLKVGGVETAIGLAYPTLSLALDIEYIVLDADGANPDFAPSTKFSANIFFRMVAKREHYILVTSLWRAHFVGFFLKLAGVNWVAFFHSAANSGHWVDRLVCRISAFASIACFFDSKQTQFEFEDRAKKKLGYVIPFLFNSKYNFCDPSSERPIDLIFVGRFTIGKRIDLCIQLAKLCIARNPNFKIAFVGYGELKDSINRLATNHPDNIHNCGLLSSAEVRFKLQQSKMILCLSDVEGMAMAVIEGIQEGCVPIARLVGELNNYLDDHAAIIYHTTQSMGELSQKVVQLATDPFMLMEMNQKARINIGQYPDYSTSFLSALRSVAKLLQKLKTERVVEK